MSRHLALPSESDRSGRYHKTQAALAGGLASMVAVGAIVVPATASAATPAVSPSPQTHQVQHKPKTNQSIPVAATDQQPSTRAITDTAPQQAAIPHRPASERHAVRPSISVKSPAAPSGSVSPVPTPARQPTARAETPAPVVQPRETPASQHSGQAQGEQGPVIPGNRTDRPDHPDNAGSEASNQSHQHLQQAKKKQKHHSHKKHHLPSHKVSDEKRYARGYMKRHYGWGNKQYRAIVKLWNRESGWNYHAHNRSSGAYGIPQALPGSKMKSAGHNWRNNSHTQIKWGLKYIKGRYHSPAKAWTHSQHYGWY